jgi:hypothetical protein
MTYIVHPDLAQISGNGYQEFGKSLSSKINILDSEEKSAIDLVPDINTGGYVNVIAYLLISHGPGGNGAYTGKSSPINTDFSYKQRGNRE